MSTATLDSPAEIELPEWITSDTLYEIIDGEYVEKESMSVAANGTAGRIAFRINIHCIAEIGEAFCEMLVTLPGSTRSRRPDVIFVSYNRWPKGRKLTDDDGWEILPEICIEVISPSDRVYAVREKMNEYFAAGVVQVWNVLPSEGILEIYTSPTQSRIYRSPEVVDCSSLIPGFQLNLAEVL